MPIVNAREFQFAFSLNKQSDIATAILASKINKHLPQRGFAPVHKEYPNVVSDRQWYGKGHSFPTFRDTVDERMIIPSREYSMTQLSALFAPAFVLGSLANSSPTSGVYDHLLTFQDPGTDPSALFTSIIEKAGAEYQHEFRGAVINSFTVIGSRQDHVTIGFDGFARNRIDNATSIPALATGQSFFKILKAAFSFGTTGAPATVSTEVLGFRMQFSQNAQPFWLPGGASGYEPQISRVLIGDQTVSGSLTVFLDATIRDYFLNQTEVEITITLTGDPITGHTTYNHTVTINIPHFKISAESFAEEGQTAAYTLTFDESSVLKGASDEFVKWTVRTDVDNSELLVAA